MCRHWPSSSSRAAARSFRGDERGATAVEFALVLWPLLLMMFGSMEVGRVVWTQTALDKTVTAAARCVGIRADGCATQGAFNRAVAISFVQREAKSWGVPLTPSEIAVEDAADCDGAPSQTRISITTKIASPVPFIAKLMSGSDTMQAKACFPTQASS